MIFSYRIKFDVSKATNLYINDDRDPCLKPAPVHFTAEIPCTNHYWYTVLTWFQFRKNWNSTVEF